MFLLCEFEKKTMKLLIFETAKNNQVSLAKRQKGHICDANLKITSNSNITNGQVHVISDKHISCKNIS
jgi:hypothetical protein